MALPWRQLYIISDKELCCRNINAGKAQRSLSVFLHVKLVSPIVIVLDYLRPFKLGNWMLKQGWKHREH